MTNKEIEQYYLNGFARTLAKFPVGRRLQPDPPSPDFLISNEDGTLGIELTRIFLKPSQGKSPPREQESLRNRITESARARCRALGQPPIRVLLFFNNQVTLRKGKVEQIAEKLAALVNRLIPDPGEQIEEEYKWVNRAYFPEAFDKVIVGRPEWLRRSAWKGASYVDLPPFSISEVQDRITEKNIRVPSYLKHCDRIWLVLCTCGEGPSSYVGLSDEAIQATYQGQFARVFIYKWPETVQELAIRRSA
jgi:hypothetical protein